MAADQRKKRLNGASIADCASRELCRVKRKKVGLLQYNLNLRSNISLEWDENKKSVVARREQIGISQRDLIPFIDASQGHNVLADVFNVPMEIFDLESLTKVLSFEVWQTNLSENEKDCLCQLLPKGEDANMVVKELLAGNNLHFGNPFLKWGASLCSGDLHPDSILHQEQCLKASRKAYYSEIQKYHNDMIRNLQMWKERSANCKDPEEEIVQKMWRSRKHTEENMPTHANESRQRDPEENLTATSESCSWAADEKACGGDHLNLVVLHGESQRRKSFAGGKYDNSSNGHKVVARPRKGEKLDKHNVQCSDGAKYMSYIKVSKEQHQRVKNSMKLTSNSIQPKSLNSVLGNLNTLHVQPFEKFEEEEQQNLHEHWLQVVNSSLPAGFANWRRLQLQKRQMLNLLGQEIEEKLNFVNKDEENVNSVNMLQKHMGNGVADIGCTSMMEDKEEKCDSVLLEQIIDETANHTTTATSGDEEKDTPNCVLPEQTDNEGTSSEEDDESVSTSTRSQFMQQASSLGGGHEFPPMDMDSDGNHPTATADNIPSNLPEYSENMNQVDIPSSEGEPLSSGSNVWPGVSMPFSYYHPTSIRNEYASSNGLSLGHPRVVDQQPAAGLINLESEMQEKNSREKDLLHRQDNNMSFFSPYPNQERNELFLSYLKDRGNLYYQREQKTGLDFQPASNVMMEAGQFPGYYADHLYPSLPLELRQKRTNNLYVHQNIDESIFSDGGRYSIPRGEHFSPANVQDWEVNTIRMSAPPQSHLNSRELLSQGWFSVEHRPRAGWPHSEGIGPNQSIGNGSNTDQSLFSVISECNHLRSSAPFDVVGSSERFSQSGNYGMVGGGIPSGSSVLQQTAHSFDYLNGRETTDGMKTNNVGWMSLPHQSAMFQDSMSKPFLSSWNR